MQEAIQKELGLKAVEEDVIVLYEGEKLDKVTTINYRYDRFNQMRARTPAFDYNGERNFFRSSAQGNYFIFLDVILSCINRFFVSS